MKQNYKNIELIIIYDDEDRYELGFLKKKIKNVKLKKKLLINKKNIGVGKSRNKGIKYSNSEFIAFLDSDDIWSKNKLKTQIKFMNKKKIDASHTSYKIINDSDKQIGIRKADKKIEFKDLLFDCNIGLSTVVIRNTKKIKKILSFPDIKTKEDYVLWLKLTKNNVIFHGIDTPLTSWRKSQNSLSSNSFQKILDGFKVYNTYLKYNYLKSLMGLMYLSLNYLKKI